MTTRAQLRKAALGLPEAAEGTRAGGPEFFVRGERFARLTVDGRVELPLPDDAIAAAVADCATAEPITEGGVPVGVTAPLADVDGMRLNAWVRAAWKHRAPSDLAAAAEAAERAEPSEGELPAAIGRPATRALHQEGLTTLDGIAERSRAELLALHGVGPKAVRLLAEALERQGKSLRG